MVKLSDYLSTLFSEITRARVESDLTSYQVAQHYSRDDVLKTFPVPHVRIKSIDITLPVIVSGVDPDSLKEYQKQLDTEVVRNNVEEAVDNTLKRFNVAAPATKRGVGTLTAEKIHGAIREPSLPIRTRAKVVSYAALDTRKLSEDHTQEVMEILAPSLKNRSAVDVKKIEQDMKREINNRLLALKPPPPVLDIEVKTGDVKETADRDSITYLNFTIYEEAFEWTNFEDSEGNEQNRLVRE